MAEVSLWRASRRVGQPTRLLVRQAIGESAKHHPDRGNSMMFKVDEDYEER